MSVTPFINTNFQKAVATHKKEEKQTLPSIDKLLISIGSIFIDNLTPSKTSFSILDVKKQSSLELQSEKITGIFATVFMLGASITVCSIPRLSTSNCNQYQKKFY